MKKLLTILFLFVSLSSFGQVLTDQKVRDTINIKLANNTSRKITEKTFRETFLTLLNYTNQIATGNPIDLSGFATITALNAKQNVLGFTPANAVTVTTQLGAKSDSATVNSVANSRVPHVTSVQLRSGIVGYPNAVILSDMQGYTFRYDPVNTMADDSAMIIRQGARRYVRVTNVLKPEFYGSDGAGPINDGVPIQKAMNAVKVWGYDVILTDTLYTTSRQLRFTGNSQFSQGIRILGNGTKSTKIKGAGFPGGVLYLNGNTSGTNGYHMKDVVLKGFTLEGDLSNASITHGLEVGSLKGADIGNLRITSFKGQGIKIFGTTAGDTGAMESCTFENIDIQFTTLWGVSASNSFADGVTMTLCTFRYVNVYTGGEGQYYEGLQKVNFFDCISVNANTYNLRFGRGNTPNHLVVINGFELGNNVNGNLSSTATALSIEYVQQMDISGLRIINNIGEQILKGIDFGSAANSYIFGLRINRPWIVQANPTQTGYMLFNFNPIATGRENIEIIEPFFSEFIAGKVSNDIGKLTRYLDQYGDEVVNLDARDILYLNTNTVIPTRDSDNYVISFNDGGSHALTINNPTANATKYTAQTLKTGDTKSFLVRNFTGLTSINFGNEYQVIDNSIPAIGKHKYYRFRYDSNSLYWYQIGTPPPVVTSQPITQVLKIASAVSTNSITRINVPDWTFPVVAGKNYEVRIRASYRSSLATTGGSMGVYLPTGAGYINGRMVAEVNVNSNAAGMSATLSQIDDYTLSSRSFLTTTDVNPININHAWNADFVFTCTTSGVFRVQWGAEGGGGNVTLDGGGNMIVQEL